nr:hypothetical protein [Streptomyces sp. F8]
MPLDPQTGVRVYQFRVDRLEESRREQHIRPRLRQDGSPRW